MKKIISVVFVVAVLAGVAFLVFRSESVDERTAEAARAEDGGVGAAVQPMSGRANSQSAGVQNESRRDKPVLDLSEDEEDDEDEDTKRTPEEKKLAADIEKALDDEDFELAKRCAPLAMKCKDAEIRQAMVDTLGWFGEKAIPELTPFLADPDEDIAENAMNEWDMAVSSIEDDGEKIGMVELAMHVVANEDFLESISGEYIGIDEKLAVESLLKVIEAGGCAKGIEKAKETYEFVTGDEFESRAAAEKWIAEEYEPPEKNEE